jgi:hypothetical protein
MDSGAIQRVTDAIELRLTNALTPGQNTVFVGPLHDDGADSAHLVLFLYRVLPTSDLRNTPHVVPGLLPNSPPIVYQNALPLDLYYILTAGGRRDGGERDSLLRLGQAVQALNDHPLLGGSALDNEVARITLFPASGDEMSRVWALFPDQNYRTSMLYTVSPVWIDPAVQPSPAEPVIETPYRTGPREVPLDPARLS